MVKKLLFYIFFIVLFLFAAYADMDYSNPNLPGLIAETVTSTASTMINITQDLIIGLGFMTGNETNQSIISIVNDNNQSMTNYVLYVNSTNPGLDGTGGWVNNSFYTNTTSNVKIEGNLSVTTIKDLVKNTSIFFENGVFVVEG